MLHHLLAESAALHPNRTAVVDQAASMTYREMDEASARLADEFAAHGVGPGDRVGLYLDKSCHALVGVWGVLRAGAAYVPLDVASPMKRAARIVSNGELRGILADTQRWSRLAPALAEPPSSAGAWCTEFLPAETGFVFAAPERSRATRARRAGLPEDDDPLRAAYVLYTSGSTGQPKGVVLSHRAALSFVGWATEVTGLSVTDVVSSYAPLHFDLSVFDLFATCKAGATVALVPPELTLFPRNLADWIAARRITVSYSVPSQLAQLALSGGLERHDFSRLRHIIFAGEVFPVAHLRRLREQIPGARYWNWYGPTETNVCTAYAVDVLPAEQTAPVPIGTACANSELVVVNDGGSECRRGEIGELYVSGPSLMTGYHGMTEATALALSVRRERGDGTLWYRTGDLVREDARGLLHLVGRRDEMIKSRGYRIELGEIESVLYQHAAVAEAAAVALPDERSGHVIRVAAVARAGQSLDAGNLRAFCAERLPSYMMPLSIAIRTSLPHGSTGKVDKLMLREELSHG